MEPDEMSLMLVIGSVECISCLMTPVGGKSNFVRGWSKSVLVAPRSILLVAVQCSLWFVCCFHSEIISYFGVPQDQQWQNQNQDWGNQCSLRLSSFALALVGTLSRWRLSVLRWYCRRVVLTVLKYVKCELLNAWLVMRREWLFSLLEMIKVHVF